MTKPKPVVIDPNDARQLAIEVVSADRFPYLASIDGTQPRLRPVSPVRTEAFTVFVANLRQYHKTIELEQNPRTEMCYMDSRHNQVRITGVAEILSDRKVIDEIWQDNPLLKQFLGSPDNPDLIIYRIVPNQVRYMQEWALEYIDIPLVSEDGSS